MNKLRDKVEKGEEVAKRAKKMGSDQGGLSEWTLDKIKKEKYKTEKISILALRKQDSDLDAYLKNSKIRRFKGKPYLMNPIVSSEGEVIDGYNRIAQKIKNGETEIEILRGIKS